MSIRFANARESVAHCSPEPQPASKARGWSKSRCGFLRGTQERGRSTSIWVGSPMAAAGLTGPLMFVTDGPCVKARWPATRLVVRESSVELMIERSLPSSRCAHAAHGTACLDRQSWAVTDGRGAPACNRQLILPARQTLQRRTITPRASGAKSSSNQPSALKPTRSRSPPLPRIRSSIAAAATHARATHTAARIGPTAKCSPNASRA